MIPYTPIYRYSILGISATPELIGTVLAFCVFLIYTYSYLKKENISPKVQNLRQYAKFAFVIIFSSLMGGRAWFYLFEVKWEGLSNILRFIDLRNGVGLVSIGMVLGGTFGLIFYIKYFMKNEKKGWPNTLARICDVMAPAAALYIFIFRLFGCSVQGQCVFGTETDVSWALFWIKNEVARHPTSFYLAFSGLFIFLILRLFFTYEKTIKTKFGKRFDGEVALWFTLLYCFNRFFIEFFRVNKRMHGAFNLVQWICLSSVFILIIWLIYNYKIKKKYLKES